MRPRPTSRPGLSPAALAQAYLDWATHLANAPGKRMQLVDKALRKAVRFANYAGRCAMGGGTAECCIEPLPQDRRFAGEDLAPVALQLHPPGVPAQSAMVAQRDHRHSRDLPAARGHGRVHVAPDPRHGLAVEFPADKSRSASGHGRQGRHESRERPEKSGRGLGARGERQEAGRQRELRGRPRRRRDAGQGRLSQPPHRAHPVRACDRRGPAGTCPHRSRLDHEILHPRSLAAELAGEISHRTGLHGVHDLVEESRPGGSRPRHG